MAAEKGQSRDQVAVEICEEIITNSKVLRAWFEDK